MPDDPLNWTTIYTNGSTTTPVLGNRTTLDTEMPSVLLVHYSGADGSQTATISAWNKTAAAYIDLDVQVLVADQPAFLTRTAGSPVKITIDDATGISMWATLIPLSLGG